jgi:hypothetical protein
VYRSIEASVKIFREEFAMWWLYHILVARGYFKNRQSPAGERSPMFSPPFGIARAAKQRDVARIWFEHIGAVCPISKPPPVSRPILVRDGTPQSTPQI